MHVLLAVGSLPTADSVSVSVYVHSATTDDLVQEYLIPAMKGGSLKVVAVTLEKSSSVESILRELPHTNVEELAIALDTYPYSKPVRSLYAYTFRCQSRTSAVGLLLYRLSSCAHLFTQSHRSLVAAAKAGLSASKTLKKFSMVLGVQNLFPIDYILTSVTRPLEELVLSRFAIRKCMHMCAEYICTCAHAD